MTKGATEKEAIVQIESQYLNSQVVTMVREKQFQKKEVEEGSKGRLRVRIVATVQW